MTLEFRPVTEEIFHEFIELEVKPDQQINFYFKRTKPNLWSLAQAYIYSPHSKCLAVYSDDVLIGSVFYTPNTAPPDHPREAWITRLMIDQRYQGQGLGRALMELLLKTIHEENDGQPVKVGLSYEPENELASKLYSSLGFEADGQQLGDQIVVWKAIE